MRKSIFVFAIALFFGNAFIGSSFAANNNQDNFSAQSEIYQEVTQNEFQNIELDKLPQAVKDAAEKEGDNVTLESAESKVLPNGEIVYRVTMDVEDKGQVTKSFYANGNKYESK